MPKVALALLLVLTGCVSVSKSVLMDRSAYPVPMRNVDVFLVDDLVPESCERVALLHASGPEGFTDEGDMWNKLREVAGELGANAVKIYPIEEPGAAERIVSALFETESDRDADAVALWCPDGTRIRRSPPLP